MYLYCNHFLCNHVLSNYNIFFCSRTLSRACGSTMPYPSSVLWQKVKLPLRLTKTCKVKGSLVLCRMKRVGILRFRGCLKRLSASTSQSRIGEYWMKWSKTVTLIRTSSWVLVDLLQYRSSMLMKIELALWNSSDNPYAGKKRVFKING